MFSVLARIILTDFQGKSRPHNFNFNKLSFLGGSYNRYDHSPGGSGMSPSRSQHQLPSSSNANSQGGQRTNKPLEASDTRNFARQQHSSSSRLEGLVHDYANVAISTKPEAKSKNKRRCLQFSVLLPSALRWQLTRDHGSSCSQDHLLLPAMKAISKPKH